MGVLTLSLLCILLGQDRPKVAVHPLQIQAERQEADLRIRFTQEILQRRISSVESRQIPTWLARQPKASCMGQTECLKRMAEAMGATYALYASLVIGETNYQMSGKIVRADGEVVRNVNALSYPRDTQQHWGDDLQKAFKAFLGELRPETLPARPVVLAAADEASVNEKAAVNEQLVVEEGGPVMELDLQEVGGTELRKGAPQRKNARSAGGTATATTPTTATPRATSQKASPKAGLPLKQEPLLGWAPASSAWARPRYMEIHKKPAPLKTTAYVMTGMSGATFIVGGIFGLMAQHQKNFLKKNAPNGAVKPGVAPQEVWSAHRKAQLYPKVGAYLAGSSLAFAGVAATLFLLSHVFEEGMPFALMPMPHGASLSFQKSF